MNLVEYSQWMSIAAIILFLVIVVVSRLLRNTVITKPKLQKGALINIITSIRPTEQECRFTLPAGVL